MDFAMTRQIEGNDLLTYFIVLYPLDPDAHGPTIGS